MRSYAVIDVLPADKLFVQFRGGRFAPKNATMQFVCEKICKRGVTT